MKKILVLLLLSAIVAPLFADDALMLPQSVWRFRIIPSFTLQNEAFNDDGERDDLLAYDSAQIWNLNLALEYGVNDWITAALQWTPGWRFASSFDDPLNVPGAGLAAAGVPGAAIPQNDKLKSTGLNDLFVGAKFQIVGPEAPVVNESHRFAFAAGTLVPLSTYDAEEEAKNYIKGDDYQLRRVDNDALGLGTRLYYDFVVNDRFFVNLYNEFIYYVPRDQEQFGVTFDPGTGQVVPDISEVEVDYGYDLTFELEPQYAMMVGEGLQLGFGLPLTYVMWPETERDGTGQEDEGYSFSVSPSVNLFAQSLPWPIDFDLSYSIPVAGKNTDANHTIALQIKNYLKFW